MAEAKKKKTNQEVADGLFASTKGVAPGSLSNKTLSSVARKFQEALGTVFATKKKNKAASK